MLTGKRILITGPTGQVARPLVAALAPVNEVFTLARFSKAEDRASIEALGAHTIATDLADGSLEQVPQDLDYVLNLAVVKSGDFEYDLRANAGGVGRLMLRTRGVKGFLHFSRMDPKLQLIIMGHFIRDLYTTHLKWVFKFKSGATCAHPK